MIEFDRLLAPIDDASPTGRNLRYVDGDLTFQSIAEARAEEDPALVAHGDSKTADWRRVVRECEEALASRTKDLELAGWLTEGLAHREGFTGIRDGLRLIRELIEAHWQRLHPGFDEEEGEILLPVRAKPLAWLGLARCFLPAVKAIPIASGARMLSYADYELSQRYAEAQGNNPGLFQQLLEAGAATTEDWRSALVRTPVDALDVTLTSVRECRAELEQLIKLCDDRFGADSPLLTPLDDLLADIADQVERATRGEAPDAEAGDLSGGALRADSKPSGALGPIATRQDALRSLSQVADFFRRTEPHSPISYLVQRAVRWGSMPLEDLLREVVKDTGALEHIWETLGMEKPRAGED